jgi:ascorbate-specific PTS system EIIC-type component UlaA
MGVINFIIENILTQASITIALIAMLGLMFAEKINGASSIRDTENFIRISSVKCRF